MISKTKSNGGEISDRTTRDYYLLIDDRRVIGMSTTLIEARACAEVIVREKWGKKVEDADVWIYHDATGAVKVMTVEPVRKLKLKR